MFVFGSNTRILCFKDWKMYPSAVYMSLVVLFLLAQTSAYDVTAEVGDSIKIPCKITGTYVLPDWTKDGSVFIVNQADPIINPAYSSRISYDTDQRTLIVNPVKLSDTGNYVCTHNGGIGSPNTTTVLIKEPEDNVCSNPCTIVNAVIAFFVLAMVVIIVAIIYCCILIRAYMEYKKMKVTQEDNNATAVLVILIISVVLFIVLIWFSVMQATVEDCEEMTKKECNINIGLLVLEIVVFVLGVIPIRCVYICHKRMKMEIIRLKILQNIISAFPNSVSVEDLRMILPGVKDIGQHLTELEEDRLISSRRDAFVFSPSETERMKMNIIRLTILQIITSASPNPVSVEDLERILPGVKDIGQHLTELEEDRLISSTKGGLVFSPSETERMKMNIIRLKILQIITSASPNPVSVEDLERILVDVERAIIVQQLKELQKEGYIKIKVHGYVRGVYFFFKTGKITGENCREIILQSLTHAYPDIVTVEDLRVFSYRIVLDSNDVIIKELENLKKDGLIISQHCGFVVKHHGSKTELIRERILQFLGYAFPKALTTDVLRKILPGVEDIGQHLNKLKEDRLISSTKGGFVFNPSETG